MLLGIDVGGTFTDAVVVVDGKITSTAKRPTTHHNLLEGILQVVDHVVHVAGSCEFSRIALSTTIVTNALVEGKTDRVGLCVIPGPGMDIRPLLPVEPYLLEGSVDHRGREMSLPTREQVEDFCGTVGENTVFAVSGKFSVRNPDQELAVSRWLQEVAKPDHISLGAGVAGTLNFVRRTNSAYYNAAVWRTFNGFADAVEKALVSRGITSPVYILKADGGTMPLAMARKYPVEAIFTGPSASVLGIMSVARMQEQAVSLDIGGTTTDIALWQEGLPLFASQGASIDKYPTAVRSFRLKSVGIGGDSLVKYADGRLQVGPMRLGPAMAVGGSSPALSDAMIVANTVQFGDRAQALKAMEMLGMEGKTPEETAQLVLAEAAQVIVQAIHSMIEEQAMEPVYRVNDIVHGTHLQPQVIIGAGGAAAGLAPLVAEKMGVSCFIPPAAEVVNAIGAAVARPTVEITFRADTVEGYYTVAEMGIKEPLPSRSFSVYEAGKMAEEYLRRRAAEQGIDVKEIEVVHTEEFNVVRGFHTMGKILTRCLQVKPGVLNHIGEGVQ